MWKYADITVVLERMLTKAAFTDYDKNSNFYILKE